MSTTEKILDRLRRPRHIWGRLVLLLVPMAVMGVWLKLLRIGAFYSDAGPLDVAAKASSDVAFGAAWVLLWLLACYFTRGRLRRTLFYLAHVATLAFGLLTVINHEYMIRTGTPLTLAKMAFAVSEGGQLGGLFGSQITASAIALIVFVVLATTVLPTVLGSLGSRLIRRRPTRRVKVVAATALVMLLVASTWTAPTSSAAFSLSAPVQLAMSPVREAQAYPAALGESPTPDPDSTKLVARDASAEQKNVVVITLESQRDSSTFPETSEPVTPILDALKEDVAIAPERGYTVLPHTSKALTSVYCGQTPPLDNQNSEADPGSLPMRCLPELLAEQGYNTTFYQSATENFERRRGTVTNFGFDEFTPVDEMDTAGYNKAGYFGWEDDIMLAPEREWLEANGDEPFLMGMLTVTAHHDYNLDGWETIDFVDDPLLNKYLNVVHYQDQFVGKVLDMFKELGLYEDTIFVITGDHGEGFGEHRIYQHDDTIYDEGLRIPYLIIDPSRDAQTVDGAANQLAVVPTVADLAGFDLVSNDEYHPSLVSGDEQGTLFATCYARGKCAATFTGEYKVIHHFGDRRDEVFNLVEDPYELHDLAAEMESEWIAEQADAAVAWYLTTEHAYANFRGEE